MASSLPSVAIVEDLARDGRAETPLPQADEPALADSIRHRQHKLSVIEEGSRELSSVHSPLRKHTGKQGKVAQKSAVDDIVDPGDISIEERAEEDEVEDEAYIAGPATESNLMMSSCRKGRDFGSTVAT